MRITANHTRTMRAPGAGLHAGRRAPVVGAVPRSSLAS